MLSQNGTLLCLLWSNQRHPIVPGESSHLHKVVIRSIEVFVQLYHQRLEEGGELALLLGGFVLGHSSLQMRQRW